MVVGAAAAAGKAAAALGDKVRPAGAAAVNRLIWKSF
jgi:hypothetical protein